LIIVLQRVKSANVKVDNKTTGAINNGILIFLGACLEDTETEARFLAKKCANLRIFEDNSGKMNLSVKDIGGQALVVSQFTLSADTGKGNRPSFARAMPPEKAEKLYDRFCTFLVEEGVDIATGIFQAKMNVELLNDGPVTIILEK